MAHPSKTYKAETNMVNMTQDELNEWARIVCEQLTPSERTFVSPEAVKAVLHVVHRSTMVPLARQLQEIVAQARETRQP
jgi:hypothetical protein